MGLISKMLTLGESRNMRKYEAVVKTINALEPAMRALSDTSLAALTPALRKRYEAGESLDALLPEAFAAVRESSVRTLGMRHFDVQLIGGMALHEGKIAEMQTGEGKTLVSVLAGYLNAIAGDSVHIVTVNDYLAKRDCEQMGKVYRFLGMTTGLVQSGMDPAERALAYQADVTYGTNVEFGFDYLRDNMATTRDARVQRGHHFAIVDEVDSILIDEARTPLVISGGGLCSDGLHGQFANVVSNLQAGVDFRIDEAERAIVATEAGLAKVEKALGIDDIYADFSGEWVNHLDQALAAQFLYHRDVDYVIVGDEVKLVDEFTGRIMEGRRLSDGLHQALEAKEGLPVREESQTLASITLQNYFRLYGKLAGMTGTAMTEEAEFRQIYNLPVVPIPTNKPVTRKDEDDVVFASMEAKLKAVVDDVAVRRAQGQPCLIGTTSIEGSERLSRLLAERGISHEVLNAKNHEHEAVIVAQAGRAGAVTVATNMAGRGTDILLGGANASTEERDAVIAAGGLRVIGTERHESRRIDNQLRGRSGRQGDPGSSQFFLSLEDDLLRVFGGTRMKSIAKMLEKLDASEGAPIQAHAVSRAIEDAQRQVEAVHFAIRKNLIEYDDVLNRQRMAVYAERQAVLEGKSMAACVAAVTADAAYDVVLENCSRKNRPDKWNAHAVEAWAANMTGMEGFSVFELKHEGDPEAVACALAEYLQNAYDKREAFVGRPTMERLAAKYMLRAMDARWVAHLSDMERLKTGIGLRAMGRRDPLLEYKEEAYSAFARMTYSMYEDFLRSVLRFKIAVEVKVPLPVND